MNYLMRVDGGGSKIYVQVALQALTIHPLVESAKLAKTVLDEIIRARP